MLTGDPLQDYNPDPDEYGIELTRPEAKALRCGLCHFCRVDDPDCDILCVHPEGAAIELTLMGLYTDCRNWKDDDPQVFPDAPFTTRGA